VHPPEAAFDPQPFSWRPGRPGAVRQRARAAL